MRAGVLPPGRDFLDTTTHERPAHGGRARNGWPPFNARSRNSACGTGTQPFAPRPARARLPGAGRSKEGRMRKYEQLVRLDEVIGLLDISKSTAYRKCREGEIPAYKVGVQWRVNTAQLAEKYGLELRISGIGRTK